MVMVMMMMMMMYFFSKGTDNWICYWRFRDEVWIFLLGKRYSENTGLHAPWTAAFGIDIDVSGLLTDAVSDSVCHCWGSWFDNHSPEIKVVASSGKILIMQRKCSDF